MKDIVLHLCFSITPSTFLFSPSSVVLLIMMPVPLIAVLHFGQEIMAAIAWFKLLVTASEIFWLLFQLLLRRFILFTWQLYSQIKKGLLTALTIHCTSYSHCRMWIRNKKKLAHAVYCLDTVFDPHGVLKFRHVDWQLPQSCSFRVRLMFSTRYICVIWHVLPDIVWDLWCKVAVFLICVQYTGRLVFACELLFCCLWCGAR